MRLSDEIVKKAAGQIWPLDNLATDEARDELVRDTRRAVEVVLPEITAPLIDMALTGFTLYMAHRRHPGDVARNQDRDTAVRFMLREGYASVEELDAHIGVQLRDDLECGRIVPATYLRGQPL